MQIVKKTDHYLLKNQDGEYHLSVDEYNKLGKEAAIELATKEIDKKRSLGACTNSSINFDQARELGFCEYGIKDFCSRLNLDITKSYAIKELYSLLDLDTFMEYPDECLHLFTNKVFNKFGGIVTFLNENRSQKNLNIVIKSGEVSDSILHELSYRLAMRVIVNFERLYPEDDRPRKAIEAKKKFVNNEISEKELSAARSAAWSAAKSAARLAGASAELSAARSAWSAARSAELTAWSSAWSSAWSAAQSVELAAWSSAWSAELAAWSSAWSEEIDAQIDILIELIKENK